MHTILEFGASRISWLVPPRSALETAGRTVLRVTVAGVETFLAWLHRARTRRHLAVLDDRMLRDIGLDRAAIWREVQKPFWRD